MRSLRLGIAVGLVALAVAARAVAGCEPGQVEIRGAYGTARFGIALADDPAERAQGLMNVPKMGSSQGMLFLYETPQHATFWMRNTLIPLDMLFADPTGRITRIHPDAVPMDETTIDGGEGVLAVLEINGGLARAIGIEEGDVMRHPDFAQESAAWPCEP